MKLLIAFSFFIAAIVIFLILYYVNYRKFVHLKTIEQFQCSGPSYSFDLKEDNETQICYNNIIASERRNINFGRSQLYYFNGTNSFAYLKDFLDNYFNLEFICKIHNPVVSNRTTSASDTPNSENEITKHILLDSKFLTIFIEPDSLNNQDLKVTYKPTNETKTLYDNIDFNTLYRFILRQDSELKQVTLSFGPSDDADSLISQSFSVSTSQMCLFSSGNDVYIGCDRDESNHINANIGNFKLNINKEKYDSYFFEDNPIPSDLACTASGEEPPTPTPGPYIEPEITAPTITTPTIDFDETTYKNYLEIISDKIFTDLKIQFYDNNIEDNLSSLTSRRLNEIDDFYSKLSIKNELISNEKIMFLEESNVFFKGYNNIRNISKEYVCYSFDLNDPYNATCISKFNFLNLDKLRTNYINFNENYICIFGERASDTSYFKFLKIKKPIFINIYKGAGNIYNYEPIAINLSLFYEYQKKYITFMVKEGIRQEDNNNDTFNKFLNKQPVFRSILNDNITPSSTIENTYIPNIYRLYESTIDIEFMVNIYRNMILQDTIKLQYKTADTQAICSFEGQGNTVFECINICSKHDEDACNSKACENICRNCQTSNCKWNAQRIQQTNKSVPKSVMLKGFAGNSSVKLSWIKPFSNYDITSYYILVETKEHNIKQNFDMYIFKSELELNDYTITNLINNKIYSFYVLSQNQAGISDVSNKVSIIPDKNKSFGSIEKAQSQINTLSDSLQNMRNQPLDNVSEGLTPSEVRERIEMAEHLIEVNALKDVLVDKVIKSNIVNNEVNINIF